MFIITRDGYEWMLEEGVLYRARENDSPSLDDEDDDWEIVYDPEEHGDLDDWEFASLYRTLRAAE